MAVQPQEVQTPEGEFIGEVWDDSQPSTASDLWFELIPADQETSSRLSGTIFSQTLWLDPGSDLPIEYFDPEAGGRYLPDPNEVCAGSRATYLAGDFSNAGSEVHPSGPGQGVPSGPETHCVVPGQYEARLWDGAPETGTLLKSLFVDYLALDGATASVGGKTAVIEAPEFDENTTTDWGDLVIHFHLNPPGGYSDTESLQIENAGDDPYKSSFSSQANPTGTVTDWFRYRTDQSSTTWGLDDRGTHLIGLWWRSNSPDDRSGFFDHGEGTVLRIHQYEGEVTPPTTVVAGVEVKRPDEDPESSPTVTKSISIIEETVACFTEDATSTWLVTDQVFDAGCSEGGDLEYRWDTGSGYGAWTDDPVLEFFGHASGGGKIVKLQVRDLAQSPVTTGTEEKPFSVSSSAVSMSGPTYVTDKQLKTYTSSVTSDWYERYLSEGSTAWYLTLNSASTYNRIWPAGEYTRRLRAEKSSPSPLGRRFLDVEVCHESISGCGVQFAVLPGSGAGATATLERDWHLFGMGPWINTGEEVTRFYDLTGLHESGSPFADLSWLGEPSGLAEDPAGRFTIEWERVETKDPDIRTVELAVTPRGSGSYRFGLAIDPDVGASPADDRSGYDPASGLVYAHDAADAVGFVLEGDANRRIAGVDQYGVSDFAPRNEGAALDAGRSNGVRLLQGEDDVQFIVSGDEISGPSTWRLTIVRAASVRELRDRVDANARR